MSFYFKDYIKYFKRRKKYLFIPLIILFFIMGLLAFFVQSSPVSPFIYTIF